MRQPTGSLKRPFSNSETLEDLIINTLRAEIESLRRELKRVEGISRDNLIRDLMQEPWLKGWKP